MPVLESFFQSSGPARSVLHFCSSGASPAQPWSTARSIARTLSRMRISECRFIFDMPGCMTIQYTSFNSIRATSAFERRFVSSTPWELP
jgi:hypothetical protein